MDTLPLQTLYDGRRRPSPKPTLLEAGPVRMAFEPETATLRDVRYEGVEVLRAVYPAVRDANWNRIPGRLHEVEQIQTSRRALVSAKFLCEERDIRFEWIILVSCGDDGLVLYSARGTALTTFRRNRIGLCVLHPIGALAGRRCAVVSTEGVRRRQAFPTTISPHQPMRDIAELSCEVAPDIYAELTLDGAEFEMEDQRNWTDASTKIYSTPIELPYPTEIRAGDLVEQRMRLRFTGKVGKSVAVDKRAVETVVRAEAERHPLPKLGLGVSSLGEPLTERELRRLRALRLSHLRVDARPSEGFASLRRAVQESNALGVRLEIALFLTDDGEKELELFAREVAALSAKVAHALVFHTSEKCASERWLTLAARYLPNHRIGGGTDAYFAELNRNRPAARLGLVAYSVNPQVHAFDNGTLVESLEAQGATVESARAFLGETPIAVTPVTLKPRHNPNATGAEPPNRPDELPSQVDVRQMSLFGAAWTLGSVKYLAEAGASSVTYFETVGWRGVMERERGSFAPKEFRSIAGGVFPLYHVLLDVSEFAEGEVQRVVSSEPTCVDALALRRDERLRLLLANYTDAYQVVRVEIPDLGPFARVKSLDASNAEAAMREPEAFRETAGRLIETDGAFARLTVAPHGILSVEPASPPE